mmetsp:Transcript_8311/g.23433  ORF Transcript_8311/g.23433 Transcript_8311/m.23433 type:complete len:448 (-) Transcript_8311:31-1374(-)
MDPGAEQRKADAIASSEEGKKSLVENIDLLKRTDLPHFQVLLAAQTYVDVALHASPHVLEALGESVGAPLVDTMAIILRRETQTRRYRRSGRVSDFVASLMTAGLLWLKLEYVTDHALDEPEGFISMAVGLILDGPAIMTKDLYCSLLGYCENAFRTCARSLKTSNVYKKLINHRIVEAAVKGMTSSLSTVAERGRILVEMMTENPLLVRKLCPPGSRALAAAEKALEGTNCPGAEETLAKLVDIGRMTTKLKDERTGDAGGSVRTGGWMCRRCGKPGGTRKCSQCKMVRYCGRACQRQDWKSHKSSCQPTTKMEGNMKDTALYMTRNYVAEMFDFIRMEMEAAYEVDASGEGRPPLRRAEFVVLIDLLGKPITHRVVAFRDFMAWDKEKLPEWVNKSVVSSADKDRFGVHTKEAYNRIAADDNYTFLVLFYAIETEQLMCTRVRIQ